jgi:hypothetical protein
MHQRRTHHRRIAAAAGAGLLGALILSNVPASAAPAGRALHVGPLTAKPNLKIHNPILKSTLATEDDGELSDIGALCQTFLGRGGNPYRPLGDNVDVINGDKHTLAGTQTGCSTAQNETPIAVNPANPKNLVAGANDYRLFNAREGRNDGSGWAYTSFDGGKTWRDIVLPKLTIQTGATGRLEIMDSAGDPAIAFGPHNRVYYVNLVFSRLSTASGIAVNVSNDGGLTWGNPNIVRLDGVDAAGKAAPTKIFNDKEWIAVDPKSGRVYVTWTRFHFTDATQAGYVSSPIVVSSSDDNGKTWSRFDSVTSTEQFAGTHVTPFGQGSVPQVGPDGTLYVAFETAVCKTLACSTAGDHDATVVARSANGGRTFHYSEVGVNFDFPVNPDTGRGTLTGEVFRINSYPAFSVDPSSGRLYVAWADDRHGLYDATTGASVQTNGDIVWASSGDGSNWSRVRTVGTKQDEVLPWVGANVGKWALSFYTRAYDPFDPAAGQFGVGLDAAMVSSGSAALHRLTTQTSDPRIQFTSVGAVTHNLLSGVFIGDYNGMAVGRDGVAHPIWTDFRGKPGTTKPNQDAVTTAVRIP